MASSSLRSLAVSLALAALGPACASVDARPCTPASCGAGRACVVGRCRPADASASPQEATRYVLTPVDVAIISSQAGGTARPEAFALGRASSGTVEVLLRFEARWADDAEVSSAFVVLEPLEGAPPAALPARVEVSRILEPWSSETVTWGRQPALSPSEVQASVRPLGRAVARVDVTPVVQRWSRRGRGEHGIALVARGDDAFGTVYGLGFAGGAGPRLEAYVNAEGSGAARAKAAADENPNPAPAKSGETAKPPAKPAESAK